MYISEINWPEDKARTAHLLLGFMIQVVESLDVTFPSEINNPLEIAKNYFSGEVSEDDYEHARDVCWKYVEDRNALREFHRNDILCARLGVSLLSANKDHKDAGEKLAWFFELLDYFEFDTTFAEKLMVEHFSEHET